MQVTQTLNEGLKRGYDIIVSAGELEVKVTEKLDAARADFQMKGFRKGKAPAALMKVSIPAWKADMPNPSWSRRASMNGVAPMARRMKAPPTTEALKVCTRNRLRSRMACALPRA